MVSQEEEPDIKQLKYFRLRAQKSTLVHTRYFFKKQYNRKFVVSKHHEAITNVLDDVIKGNIRKLMVNIGPRYGKTEIAVKNFVSHCLSLNASSKYIHLSYSDELALDNSEGIKDIVMHESYRELFPEVQIKKDSKSKKKWYTTTGGGVYATSTAGQVTGFGAGQVDKGDNQDVSLAEIRRQQQLDDEELARELDEQADFIDELEEMYLKLGINRQFGGALVIDDPIKPEDADSETRRQRINDRYDSTIKNRVNSRKTPVIIIMQRLHENDLCGYLLQNEPGEWTVLSLPAIQVDDEGNETALWPFKHDLAELKRLKDQNPMVFERQMMQNPTPAGGYLYGRPWKTYTVRPFSRKLWKKGYADTADTGADLLCSIAYDETELGMYVTDIVYTAEPMEVTEPRCARQIYEQGTERYIVESNNGGRGWARNVEAQTRLAGNLLTVVEWFHQSGNKFARILTNATTAQNLVHFPEGWEQRWPKFAKHLKTYMAAGGNAHDDAEDTLTGMVEFFGNNPITIVWDESSVS